MRRLHPPAHCSQHARIGVLPLRTVAHRRLVPALPAAAGDRMPRLRAGNHYGVVTPVAVVAPVVARPGAVRLGTSRASGERLKLLGVSRLGVSVALSGRASGAVRSCGRNSIASPGLLPGGGGRITVTLRTPSM